MSDRVKGFVVTLEKDVRLDDVELLMQTIRYMRGVANVEPSIVDSSDWINQQRVRNELRAKMYQFIEDNLK
jgi:hypothetical protein